MNEYLVLLLLCGFVTWVPRILPFIFTRKLVFPKKVTVFLSYLPLCILWALLLQSLIEFHEGGLPTIKVKETLACLPTFLVGYYTKDLMKIVVAGVITMAAIRFFF